MIAPVAPCSVCGAATPYDWPSCAACGAQRLLTPDGDHAGFRALGGPWRRLLATFFDVGLFVIVLVVAGFLPDRIADPSPTQGDEALRVAILLAATLYFPVSLGATGRTLGKRLMRLHVVTWDGSAVTYPRAAVRDGVIKIAELYAIGAAIAVGVGWGSAPTGARIAAWVLLALPVASVGMLFGDARRRMLHDRGAATVCVDGPPLRALSGTASPLRPTPPEPGPAASAPAPGASAGSAPAG
jgi:uncharacterized RDD family membrane protein YckC